jgi:hypothetical protein
VQSCLSFPDVPLFLSAPLLNWARRRETETQTETGAAVGNKNLLSVKMIIITENLMHRGSIDIFSSKSNHEYQSDRTGPLLLQLLPHMCRRRRTNASWPALHVIKVAEDVVVVIQYLANVSGLWKIFFLRLLCFN